MKQARMLDDKRVKIAIKECRSTREQVILLLAVRAGLRAVEIAGLTWANVDLEGATLLLKTTKGDIPRHVPIAKDLSAALIAYRGEREGVAGAKGYVLVNSHSNRGAALTGNAIAVWFRDFFGRRLGWEGYSSHSGRRTFATNAARKIGSVGGSIRDVQEMLGHAFMSTTQRYVDTDPEAQRRIVDII